MDVELTGSPNVLARELEAVRQAGRVLVERLDEQTQTMVGLQGEAMQLQGCIALRDEEIKKLNEQLRVVQRELDETRRESLAKVKVHLTAIWYGTQLIANALTLFQYLRASRVRTQSMP